MTQLVKWQAEFSVSRAHIRSQPWHSSTYGLTPMPENRKQPDPWSSLVTKLSWFISFLNLYLLICVCVCVCTCTQMFTLAFYTVCVCGGVLCPYTFTYWATSPAPMSFLRACLKINTLMFVGSGQRETDNICGLHICVHTRAYMHSLIYVHACTTKHTHYSTQRKNIMNKSQQNPAFWGGGLEV